MALYSALQVLRGNYDGRIHSSRGSGRGPHHEVVKAWIEAFFADFIERISFKATFSLHDGPIPLPYPGDEHFPRHWIKSTKANLLAHVRWTLHEYDLLSLRPVFDTTGQAKERRNLQLGADDARFEINERRRKGKHGYPVTLMNRVVFQSSDHRKAQNLEEAINAEMLQLTDVLLGASADALSFRPGASKTGRRRLASRISDEIARRHGRSPFAFQRFQRHFSVSLYPDALGRTYGANPAPLIGIREGEQQPLFAPPSP